MQQANRPSADLACQNAILDLATRRRVTQSADCCARGIFGNLQHGRQAVRDHIHNVRRRVRQQEVDVKLPDLFPPLGLSGLGSEGVELARPHLHRIEQHVSRILKASPATASADHRAENVSANRASIGSLPELLQGAASFRRHTRHLFLNSNVTHPRLPELVKRLFARIVHALNALCSVDQFVARLGQNLARS